MQNFIKRSLQKFEVDWSSFDPSTGVLLFFIGESYLKSKTTIFFSGRLTQSEKSSSLKALCAGLIVLPVSPRVPPGHNFFGDCPGLFITLFLPCPALINHFNPFIFECSALFSLHLQVPRPFYHTHFSLTPVGIGAEQFDRRIIYYSWVKRQLHCISLFVLHL